MTARMVPVSHWSWRPALIGAQALRPGDPREEEIQGMTLLPNPKHAAWVQRVNRGKRAGREPEAFLSPCVTADGGPWAGGLLIPRRFPCKLDAADRRQGREAEALTLKGQPRWYQMEAADAVDAAGGGVVEAPCGAGKSWIGLELVARHATPALILVHTTDLQRQWAGHVRGKLGVEPALLGGGKKHDPGRVTIAMLQTLSRWSWWDVHSWATAAGFGLVIADECHHVPAESWSRVMLGLPARLRVGVTATKTRRDGLTPWIDWHLGETVYRVDPGMLEDDGHTLAPRIVWVEGSACEGFDSMESHERAAALAEDEARNARVVDLAQLRIAAGGSVLMLPKRKAHAEALGALAGLPVLTSDTATGERERILAGLRSGEIRGVVATSLADEGLDVPRLDTVILMDPTKDQGKTAQRVGRICRPHEGALDPVVYDVRDRWGAYLGYARSRAALYRRRGWL